MEEKDRLKTYSGFWPLGLLNDCHAWDLHILKEIPIPEVNKEK